MARELTPKQRQWITAYQSGMPAVQAAIDAGYSRRSARHAAYSLMHENPRVRAELDRLSALAAKQSELTTTSAMERLDTDITQAKQANQHSAVAKFRELQMRLAGLLRDKLEVSVEHRVDVNGALEAARARASLRPGCDLPPPIDGEFKALPGSQGARSVDNKSTSPLIGHGH